MANRVNRRLTRALLPFAERLIHNFCATNADAALASRSSCAFQASQMWSCKETLLAKLLAPALSFVLSDDEMVYRV